MQLLSLLLAVASVASLAVAAPMKDLDTRAGLFFGPVKIGTLSVGITSPSAHQAHLTIDQNGSTHLFDIQMIKSTADGSFCYLIQQTGDNAFNSNVCDDDDAAAVDATIQQIDDFVGPTLVQADAAKASAVTADLNGHIKTLFATL